ncbi:MAG: hypothetical protein K8H88_11820 [Sandaracinaceae bacterium]|nr:hypothetical protein [Sandaracinaceae bacterium]
MSICRARPSIAALLLTPIAILNVAANCNPEKPGCRYGAVECGYQYSTPPPGDVVPACINFCAPQPEDDPGTTVDERVGAQCAVDPCRTDLWMDTAVLCPPGWSCLPDDPVTPGDYGTCVRVGQSWGMACEPAERFSRPCENNTFCLDISACGAPEPTDLYDETAAGVCWLMRREGAFCDGGWQDPGSCSPCAPGLECVDGTCRRPCGDDDDCPCDTDTVDFSCEDTGSANHCTFCYENNADCSGGQASCCDPISACVDVEGDGTDYMFCCREGGVECTNDSECCNNLRCHPGLGTCQACVPRGEAYDPMNPLGCCTGLVARDFEEGGTGCLPPCDDGVICQHCRHNLEVYGDHTHINFTCTDEGPVCDRSAYIMEADDDCDGYDDDCDGRFDEDFPDGDPCYTPLLNGHCPTESFNGVKRCYSHYQDFSPSGGQTEEGWTCQQTPGVDYCEWNADTGQGAVPGPCTTFNALCDSDDDCSPDTYCTPVFPVLRCLGCNSSGGWMCWPPGERGNNCGGS